MVEGGVYEDEGVCVEAVFGGSENARLLTEGKGTDVKPARLKRVRYLRPLTVSREARAGILKSKRPKVLESMRRRIVMRIWRARKVRGIVVVVRTHLLLERCEGIERKRRGGIRTS